MEKLTQSSVVRVSFSILFMSVEANIIWKDKRDIIKIRKGARYMIEKSKLETLNSLDLFLELFNNMTDLVFLTKVNSDQSFSYILLNKPAKDLYGLTNESFGKPIEELLPKSAYQTIKRKYQEAMDRKKPIVYEDKVSGSYFPNSSKNSDFIYWESTITPVFNQEGKCTHLLAIVRDLTDQRQRENLIKEMKERFELVWNSVADAMYIFDKNEYFVSVNKAFERLFGWTEEEVLNDRLISILPEDSKEEFRNIIEKIKMGETVSTQEVKRVKKNGEWIHFLASYSPLYNQNGDWNGGVVVYKDITERKKYEEKLRQLALQDPLTGLANRTYFSHCLIAEMEKAKRTKQTLSVFVLDIDHFKEINDTFGHDIGDEVLKVFAKRVKSALRKNDILARIGGDEFVILLPDLTEENNVSEIADRIQQSLHAEWIIANEKIHITSSIGISLLEDFNIDEKVLFKHADLALYKAKKKGKNNYQIYKE